MALWQDTSFRSAYMSMVQLYVSNDIDREVVTALGKLGLCQFCDISLHTHTKSSIQATHLSFQLNKNILQEAGGFFNRALGNVKEIQATTHNGDAPLLSDLKVHNAAPNIKRLYSGIEINFITSIISRDRNKAIKRNVFLIFTHSKEIVTKIQKIPIAESIGGEVYNIDENSDLRRDQIHAVNNRLENVQSVLHNTQTILKVKLNQIAQSLSV
ncbi:uncharacterized protein FPRN_15222 [Fusarium proliferatum]|nr:uncharacterized protein FPRN_15222 [Fusarium proliferatum]